MRAMKQLISRRYSGTARDERDDGAPLARSRLHGVLRTSRMLQIGLLALLVVLSMIFVMNPGAMETPAHRLGKIATPPPHPPVRPPQEDHMDPLFHAIDETVLPAVVVRAADQVCAMCTDGLVYVHVGRPPHATETVSAAPVQHTVTEEMQVRLATAPVFSAGSGAATAAWPSSAVVVQRCVAQLLSLGQMGAAQNAALARDGAAPVVSAAVVVDYDAEGGGVSVGRADQCPAFLAEVRPVAAASADDGAAKMDVSYPRLPSWPLRAVGDAALDAPGASAPPYFGTARVLETDVDRDVQPPESVVLTGDRSGVVIRFGRDETSTKSEPFEMVCSSHFLSVFIGRYGRQHNQVQEIVHTLALSKKLNRTFIVPVLLPETNVLYLRYDAQKLYGFNALRREGGYCLLSYAEARTMLKELEAEKEPMTLRRYNYYADTRPRSEKEWAKVRHDGWHDLPPIDTETGARVYNVDAWLEDSKARSPPVTSIRDARDDGMNFTETGEDFTVKDVFPNGDEAEYVRMACMRRAVSLMVEQLGGDHVAAEGVKLQPRLGILTSRMAFYVHPSLREQTLLMGLLRPSDAIVKEADRLYSQTASKLLWPVGATNGNNASMHNTLRPINLKHVIGLHIRRREGTCRKEGVIIGRTAYPIDPRFQLDKVDPSWASPLSTLRNMELDCALSRTRLVELYRQYTRWMRHNMTADADAGAAAAAVVPTIYMAYDDQSGPIAEQVDRWLMGMSRGDRRGATWGEASTFPQRFVNAYDVRISGSFRSVYNDMYRKLDAKIPKSTRRKNGRMYRNSEGEEQLRVEMMQNLYEPLFKEMFAMAFDYFVLTNTGMFRGVAVSSVSTNVMVRRWGRGLPCHGILAGYVSSFYTSMWF